MSAIKKTKPANGDDVTTETKIVGKDKFQITTVKNTFATTTVWLKNKKAHRDDDLPAIVLKRDDYCRCEWFIDGKDYRNNDKPTVVVTNGNNVLILELWRIGGVSHRENGPAERTYHENGNVEREIYFKNDKIHREDGPAIVAFDENKNKEFEGYYENGNIKNRGDLPNSIVFHKNGHIYFKEWLIDPETRHRENGPAYQSYDENGNLLKEIYSKNGKIHREDGPAIIVYENNHKKIDIYCENDLPKNRGDLPNYIEYNENGTIVIKQWQDENKNRHRENNPAREIFYETGELKAIAYFKHEKLHRLDGPAIVNFDKNGQIFSTSYFANGRPDNKSNATFIGFYPNGQKKMEEWAIDADILHRDDGPTNRFYYPDGKLECEKWHLNNKLTRNNGPAISMWYPNGNIKLEMHYFDGIQHRDNDLPSVVTYFEHIPGRVKRHEWIENGTHFRANGMPTIVNFDENGNETSAEYDGG